MATLEKIFPDLFDRKSSRTDVVTAVKPKMRGLLQAQMRKHLYIGMVLSCVCGLTFKLAVADPRKRKYAEFYRTYDTEKACEEMRRKGLFQSC